MPLISFPANGHSTPGYLGLPPHGSGPGLIVVQEWWGLVGHITSVADRFAAAGFVALAPDLYHGEPARSPDDAGKKLMALNIEQAGKDLHGAAVFLRAHERVAPRKVAALGFCMGGQLALYAGQEHPDVIDAVVDFYGIHPNVTIVPERLKVPVLGHFAERDKSVPVAAAATLTEAVNAAGGSMTMYTYAADHAFFNDERKEVYSADNAALAWDRTIAFLHEHLR